VRNVGIYSEQSSKETHQVDCLLSKNQPKLFSNLALFDGLLKTKQNQNPKNPTALQSLLWFFWQHWSLYSGRRSYHLSPSSSPQT
jgi:hypothetical protein